MSAKELLYEKIQAMTEAQARRVLDVIVVTEQTYSKQELWKRLSKISGIKVPEEGFKAFPHVEPLEILGMPASQLLIEERR